LFHNLAELADDEAIARLGLELAGQAQRASAGQAPQQLLRLTSTLLVPQGRAIVRCPGALVKVARHGKLLARKAALLVERRIVTRTVHNHLSHVEERGLFSLALGFFLLLISSSFFFL
jgi:hypothetical protein